MLWRLLAMVNTTSLFVSGCSLSEATIILELRQYNDFRDFRTKLLERNMSQDSTASVLQMFEDTAEIFQGYNIVDDIIEECEQVGAGLKRTMDSWPSSVPGNGARDVTCHKFPSSNLAAHLDVEEVNPAQDFMVMQPSYLVNGTVLKDYQMYGVNWLKLLYLHNWGCILADDMGALALLRYKWCSRFVQDLEKHYK
jgi:SWI/SNF-related matrix-associated actin-dependent regulator of chromatin subfamily A containing DEAD/H box 1